MRVHKCFYSQHIVGVTAHTLHRLTTLLTRHLRAILRVPSHLTHVTNHAVESQARLPLPGWQLQHALLTQADHRSRHHHHAAGPRLPGPAGHTTGSHTVEGSHDHNCRDAGPTTCELPSLRQGVPHGEHGGFTAACSTSICLKFNPKLPLPSTRPFTLRLACRPAGCAIVNSSGGPIWPVPHKAARQQVH